MLGQAGFKENDIPGTWKEYWSFWCDKVQPGIRKATGQRIYGIAARWASNRPTRSSRS